MAMAMANGDGEWPNGVIAIAYCERKVSEYYLIPFVAGATGTARLFTSALGFAAGTMPR